MVSYLIFDTEAEASAADKTIMSVAINLYRADGTYTISVDDGIIPKTNGVNVVSGTLSKVWAIPAQRFSDGKWYILHPDAHVMADKVVGSRPDNTPVLAIDLIMAELGPVVDEPWSNTWTAPDAI